MKTFIRNFFTAIPLAIGTLLTLFSVVFAMEPSVGDNGFSAIVLGLIGIPTLFAAILNISKE